MQSITYLIFKFFLGAVLFLVLWTLSLPVAVDGFILLGVVLLLIKLKPPELVLILSSVILVIGVLEYGVRVIAGAGKQGEILSTYYRPHEVYQDKGRYLPNINTDYQIKYGDIVPMDPVKTAKLKQPRQVKFITDSMGYRNMREYQPGDLVLVGDSFIAGNGVSQESTLQASLAKYTKRGIYSIGFPGDLSDYLARAKLFAQTHPDARFVMFVFEGNDFAIPTKRQKEIRGWDKTRFQILSKLRITDTFVYPRLVFGISRQAMNKLFPKDKPAVVVDKVGDQTMAFYGQYMDVALHQEPRLLGSENLDEGLLNKIDAIYFIPTKFRIYKPFLKQQSLSMTEPAPAYAVLLQAFRSSGIPVVDLTPVLQQGAAEMLGKNQRVFWRDDTHWNQHGTDIVAQTLAKRIN